MKTRVLYALIPALLLGIQNDAIAAPKSAAGGETRVLTYRNVIAFFHEALRQPPTRVDARCAIFSEGEWANANIYNQSVIMVENADEDLEIIFIMTGDEGMNWVNEFFDSPFFARAETEYLFKMLNSGPGAHRGKMRRFQVELSRWQPRHHEIVVVSLTPKSR